MKSKVQFVSKKEIDVDYAAEPRFEVSLTEHEIYLTQTTLEAIIEEGMHRIEHFDYNGDEEDRLVDMRMTYDLRQISRLLMDKLNKITELN